MQVFVFASRPEEIFLTGRTVRSLTVQGLSPKATLIGDAALAQALNAAREPLLLVRAGCWLCARISKNIPASVTGKPLLGIGQTRHEGGLPEGENPEVRCLYLSPESAALLADALSRLTLEDALQSLIRSPEIRSVAMHQLAHGYDARLRILQVVTSIQVGGAERVTLDLAEQLTQRGNRVWVAALGNPIRDSYSKPNGFFDLSAIRRTPQARGAAIVELARRLRVDVVHGHLILGPEAEAVYARGIPLVVTMHNMPASWPKGFETPLRKADLIIACSQAVENAVEAASLGCPVRTAWNGIAAGCYVSTPALRDAGMNWRRDHGWGVNDLVVIAVANPRSQKRLERIPEISHKLKERLPGVAVRCIIAGEPGRGNADSIAARAALEHEIQRWDVEIVQTGGRHVIPTLLAASDVFLSVSAHEGLSLSHLEALAAGLPVVATRVGGASEIAREMPAGSAEYYQLLDAEASAEMFVAAILATPDRVGTERVSHLPAAFQREKMAVRVEDSYRIALAAKERCNKPRSGLWIVINNFSMGGAQSSARRLLCGLKERGIPVHALTVEELPNHQTAGTQALLSARIPVTCIPPARLLDPALGAARVMAAAAKNPPQAVLFWNLSPTYKILLADGLVEIPCFDISPGEMNFQSLDRYFLKPRTELPYRDGLEYGKRLAGVIVKYKREIPRAQEALGRKAVAIPNGVPILEFQRTPNSNGKLIFGTAVRISPDKRLEDLVEAFLKAHAHLPPYEWRIAGRIERGADDYAEKLRVMASPLPVRWLGELPDTRNFLKGLDVFVMISEPAGCPNASLEAMAAGLPVIATDVGGANEQVIDRETGRLVARRDAGALAEAMITLAHMAPEDRQRCGSAGQRRIRECFSMEHMISRYSKLCLQLEP